MTKTTEFTLVEREELSRLLSQNCTLTDIAKLLSKDRTIWFESTPQGKFMLSVAFGQAKYYTDNLIKSRFAR